MPDINRDWEKVYEAEATPWDVGQPENALVEFTDSGLVKPCRVLEIGCGNGNDAIFLAKKGFDVTAIDISKNAIENAKNRAKEAGVKCDFLVEDIMEVKSLPEIFEFVYDRGCFHFVPENKREKYVEIVKKFLIKGGYFILIVSSDKETPKGPCQFSKEDIKKIFGNDFDILDIRLIILTQHKEKPTPYLCTMKRK
jgi:SAM-dependent methyltransferase